MKGTPWNFESGDSASAHIKLEYAELLLRLLPDPCCIEEAVADSLVDAYRVLTRSSANAFRRCHSGAVGAGQDDLPGLRRRANAISAACRLVHLQLVALHLNSLQDSASATDISELVLVAERHVEALVEDID